MKTTSLVGALLTAILVVCPLYSHATVKVPALIGCGPGIGGITICTFSISANIQQGIAITGKTTEVLTADDVAPQFNAVLGKVKDLQMTINNQTAALNNIANRNSDAALKQLVREVVEQVLKEKNLN